MYPPNILITNYCNQNCSFCFAKLEMNNIVSHDNSKEMTLMTFKMVLKKIKKSGLKTIKLMGGEPTLHSQFEEIIKLSLEKFKYIHIFTNGILPEEKIQFLTEYLHRIKFIVNLTTPGFQDSMKIRNLIKKLINDFSKKAEITISLTINPHSDIHKIMKKVSLGIIRRAVSVRVGIENPILNKKNNYSFEEFSKIGQQIFKLTKLVKKNNIKANIQLSCGFIRCMFTDKQYEYLKDKILSNGWGCFGKTSSFDMTPNIYSFHCFPLSRKDRLNIKKISLANIFGKFLLKRYEYWKEMQIDACKNCIHKGYEIDKCPGPCIAYVKNNLTGK